MFAQGDERLGRNLQQGELGPFAPTKQNRSFRPDKIFTAKQQSGLLPVLSGCCGYGFVFFDWLAVAR